VYGRIVCDQCEKSFSKYDDYAIKVLKQNLDQYERVHDRGELIGVIAKGLTIRFLNYFRFQFCGGHQFLHIAFIVVSS